MEALIRRECRCGHRRPAGTGETDPGRSSCLPPTMSLKLTLILFCVALAALFGLACVFDGDGDLTGALRQTEGVSCTSDESLNALARGDSWRLIVAPAARLPFGARGLLAAVPGGLCLLI